MAIEFEYKVRTATVNETVINTESIGGWRLVIWDGNWMIFERARR